MMKRCPDTCNTVRSLISVLAALLLAGCQSLYFQTAGPAPGEAIRYSLRDLPFREYWTGIVFNGEKIGFTRFRLAPLDEEDDRYEILSEASFILRFLGIEKKVHLKARDVVNTRLELLALDYDYRIDGSQLVISGHRTEGMLAVTVTRGGEPSHSRFEAGEPLHPASVIALYPVVHGLSAGREYRYRVYDGQLQTIAEVVQRVEGYESSRFFAGNAFKLATSMHGQRTTTWIDHSGRPVFELALRGVMISALEEEAAARRYVALAALNRQETLIEFSLIRVDTAISDPRNVAFMKAAISGLDRMPPDGAGQRCDKRRREIECEIVAAGMQPAAQAIYTDASHASRYLEPSPTVQSMHASIRAVAAEIAAGATEPAELVRRIVAWMDSNIEKTPHDVFSALDVLQQRKAECQGHAYLYTALARALGIPTRVVSGLVYSEQLKGFLFHSWAESLVDGRWLAVDPTFGQTSADATHIKLLEGEALSDLLPLTNWVGRLNIRILALRHAEQ
jgi:hypothetical protein